MRKCNGEDDNEHEDVDERTRDGGCGCEGRASHVTSARALHPAAQPLPQDNQFCFINAVGGGELRVLGVVNGRGEAEGEVECPRVGGGREQG